MSIEQLVTKQQLRAYELSSLLVDEFLELAAALPDQSQFTILAYMSLGCWTSPPTCSSVYGEGFSALETV